MDIVENFRVLNGALFIYFYNFQSLVPTGQEGNNIIFELGVLILELITGQSSEKGGVDLIQWVQESRLSISIQKMIDPDLGNSYDTTELNNLLAVARLCIKSGDQPTFSLPQIFRYLHKKLDIPRD